MMRNKRLIIALTGAVICGLIGVMLVTRYLSNVQAYARDLGTVVVAKTEIPLGEKITAEQVTLTSIPNGSTPDGAFRKLDQVVGRVAIMPIGLRETITSQKLAPAGTGGGLSAVIPEGYRAMTVKVDDVVGVSGFVMPGSHVDVVAVISPQAQQGYAQDPVSKIVLQNIKVLATGAKIDSPENQREPTAVKAVTLLVTPQQAEKLALASNEGKLQLVMRSYGDQDDTETKGASKTALLTGYSPTAITPPKPEKPVEPAAEPKKSHVKPARVVEQKEPAPLVQAQPVRRNSIELIEGAKRRDVDMPPPK
jgi:pilus assembly protein CpaB